MKHLKKQDLKELTTLGVGGKADDLFFPESKQELIDLLHQFRKEGRKYYLLGNGSNLLIAEGRLRTPVICTKFALAEYSVAEDGTVIAGAAVDIRKLINDCANRGLRSPVELLTIPASVGGAIYMNAGRTSLNVDISQNLIEVEIFDGNQISTLPKDACVLGHRRSYFHDRKDLTLLSAKFHFPPAPKAQIAAIRRYSLEQGATKCYRTEKSAGSVFKHFDPFIVRRLMGLKFGGAMFAPKTPNCILNIGNATYFQIMVLIRWAQFLHKIRGKRCVLEWEIWNS